MSPEKLNTVDITLEIYMHKLVSTEKMHGDTDMKEAEYERHQSISIKTTA